MDIKMSSSTGIPPIWDCLSVKGIVSFIRSEEEKLQSAQLSTFLNLGSTPQLPTSGVDWLGFFTGTTTFGEVDSKIRNNINISKGSEYFPDYELVNNKLKVTIKRG
jgi:hypothetical protein